MLARFRLFGVPVSIHPSVVVVVVLLGWLSGLRRPGGLAVWIGAVFLSLLVHELGHALTARRLGSEVEIELAGLGGLTRWTTPVSGVTPGRTALVSAAGSLAGFLLAGVVWAVSEVWGPFRGLAGLAVQVIFYANIVWGLLNWLPIRPLDGGHLLLAFLHRVAPQRAQGIARAVFIGTAAVGGVFAFSRGLLFAAALAGWMLISELGASRPVAAPIPEFGYDDPDEGTAEEPPSADRPPWSGG